MKNVGLQAELDGLKSTERVLVRHNAGTGQVPSRSGRDSGIGVDNEFHLERVETAENGRHNMGLNEDFSSVDTSEGEMATKRGSKQTQPVKRQKISNGITATNLDFLL